jgi:hypothetical protein
MLKFGSAAARKGVISMASMFMILRGAAYLVAACLGAESAAGAGQVPVTCGDAAGGHCYAISMYHSPVNFGHVDVTVAPLSYGSMIFIDDEAWLVDNTSKPCRSSTCWVEAGYDSESPAYIGGYDYFAAWSDGQTFTYVPLAQVPNQDIGHPIGITLRSGFPKAGSSTIALRTPQAPSGSGAFTKVLQLGMTPTQFMFGQELAGAGDASAGQAIFSNIRVAGASSGPGSALPSHAETTHKPPYGRWLRPPEAAHENATFATQCCSAPGNP